MPKIFINYRRDDTAGYAGRIHDSLSSRFGSDAVFMDFDDIRPGADFVRVIEDGIARCDVMLVLIGQRWLEAEDSSGRKRIDNPEDFVRLEIAKALERKVRVIPVLVNGGEMPAGKDLPAELARLAHIQAMQLSDERWEYDLGQLLEAIGGAETGRRKSRRSLVGVAVVCFIVLLGVVFALTSRRAEPLPDVTGRWMADVQYDFGESYSEEFVFRVEAGSLGGSASFLGLERGIVEGKIEDGQISFTTRTQENFGDETRQIQHRYRGTIIGDEIRFVMLTEGGSSVHTPVELIAKRIRRGS